MRSYRGSKPIILITSREDPKTPQKMLLKMFSHPSHAQKSFSGRDSYNDRELTHLLFSKASSATATCNLQADGSLLMPSVLLCVLTSEVPCEQPEQAISIAFLSMLRQAAAKRLPAIDVVAATFQPAGQIAGPCLT